jgi:hypothetical protein
LFPILLNFKIFPSNSAMTTDTASVGFCKPRYSVAIDAAKLESIFQFLASKSRKPALNAAPFTPENRSIVGPGKRHAPHLAVALAADVFEPLNARKCHGSILWPRDRLASRFFKGMRD